MNSRTPANTPASPRISTSSEEGTEITDLQLNELDEVSETSSNGNLSPDNVDAVENRFENETFSDRIERLAQGRINLNQNRLSHVDLLELQIENMVQRREFEYRLFGAPRDGLNDREFQNYINEYYNFFINREPEE